MFFFFSSRRRHTRLQGDWSSDVCSSDLTLRFYLEAYGERPGTRLLARALDQGGHEVWHDTLALAGTEALAMGLAGVPPGGGPGGGGPNGKGNPRNPPPLLISYPAFSFKKKKTTNEDV